MGLKAPTRLHCGNHVDPIGIDDDLPRLSWEVLDDRRGARQTAFEVQVASSSDALSAGEADRWGTGRVDGSATSATYAGTPLQSRDRCWWRVRTWDADGEVSPWSDPAWFEVGLRRPFSFWPYRDWAAQVIRSQVRGNRQDGAPSPFFRRDFEVPGEVVRARLYITALGLHEAWINGQRVTTDQYRPGWTDYRLRIPYQVYDVTSLVRSGDNVVGAVIGDGWYCGHVAIGGGRQTYGERPGLYAQLEVFVEGQDDPVVVPTGPDWSTTTGPILSADNYMGEHYDARLELDGWSEPGFDDAGWDEVEVSGPILAGLVETIAPPVRATEELRPVAQWESSPGVHVFDLGQNMVGHVRLTVRGAAAGTEVTLRHAEVLEHDGRTIHTKNLNRAKATDTYICKGGDREVYEPRFTFHGFRYVEVSGCPGTPEASDVIGVVIHSDMERTGTFECSHPLITKLAENIVWSQRGNFVDVPTDCPQRYERLGWTGDIAMFVRAAVFNYDASTFLRKWMFDLVDSQIVGGVEDGQFPSTAPRGARWGGGPAWADAAILVPWQLYTVYGDERTLHDVWPALQRWLDFMDRQAEGRAPDAWPGFGDWVSLDFDPENHLGLDDRWGGTPIELLRLAFHAHACDLMSRIAEVIGRPKAESEQLRNAFARRRQEFIDGWTEQGRLTHPTQTACTVALTFDLLAGDKSRALVGEQLASDVEERGHLVTGFVGTPWLLHALERVGRLDLAFSLIEREESPGWLYPVTKGATTMWERWDAIMPDGEFHPSGMNSFNHYAYGAVGHWLHRTIGGLDVDDDRPGTGRLRIAPRPGGTITWANTTLQTIRGPSSVRWSLAEDGASMTLAFTVPANSAASVALPVASVTRVVGAGRDDGLAVGDIEGISSVTEKEGVVTFEVGAGSYELLLDQPVVV